MTHSTVSNPSTANAIPEIWGVIPQSAVFASLMESMSRPGNVADIRHCIGNASTQSAVLATLVDSEVSYADPTSQLTPEDEKYLQAPKQDASLADFIVCEGSKVHSIQPKIGSLLSPDYSATLLLVVKSLSRGDLQLNLSGAGIENSTALSIAGLSPEWLNLRQQWNCEFPLGVDWILCAKDEIAAIPRTTRVEVAR